MKYTITVIDDLSREPIFALDAVADNEQMAKENIYIRFPELRNDDDIFLRVEEDLEG